MKISKRFFFYILFFACFKSYADKLEKGFEKLNAYDYFAAKLYFEKSLEDDMPAAAYGLSAIYSFDKNPFYNPDSARKFILIADSTYKLLKDKTKKKYEILGVTDSTIISLSEFICMDAFNKAVFKNTLGGFNHFLKYYVSCAPYSEATTLRNEAAFNNALSKNTSTAFKEFVALYPQAIQYRDAISKYEELVYKENTVDQSIESYEQFILNFPENPYRSQAEKMIYSLNVPDKTLEQYVAYVRKYKGSRFSRGAWQEIYKLSMKDYSEETFNNFKNAFPDYPYPEELESDYRLQNYFFLPIENNKKWGYINEQGQEMIKPVFDEASLFSEGLAVISDSGKYGYINKAGKKIISCQFNDAESFHNGAAVVRKDSLYGLINRGGEFIIPANYQELTEVSEDIFMGVKNDNSGYIHKDGDTLTGFVYDLAGDFRNGYAIVNKNERFGLINSKGEIIINPQYAELVFIGNGLLKALIEEEVWGILKLNGDTLLPFEYEAIGEFHDNRALVAKNNKCGYIDEKGILIIPLKFLYTSILLTTGQFQNGFALLKQNNKSVIIDTTGKAFTIPGGEDYGRPSDGFVPVRKNKKWGYAGMNGKIKIPCKYEAAESFMSGIAIIRQNKMLGVMDSSGYVYISPAYEDIIIKENSILVSSNGKSGLITRGGLELIPISFEKIEFLSPAIVRATNPGELVYLNLDGGKVIYSSKEN